jgi:AcrR family transcriptional regulator
MATRPYTATARRSVPSTEARILDAADALVQEGAFHEATMDDLARRAGVARATVFTRFGTKLGVLQALSVRCAGGREMRAIRAAFAVDDPGAALSAVVAAVCALWERHGAVLRQLQAVATLEPGAQALVADQREDQRSSLEDLVHRLARAGRLRKGLGERRAVAALHMLTSVEAFVELRHAGGLSEREVRETLQRLVQVAVLG